MEKLSEVKLLRNKVLNNVSWIIGCKIIQSLISLVIGMVTARYLGPSQYGLISYAASVVAFFQPIVKLGLDSTLVQEFVNAPEDEGKILGTSLGLSIIASIASIVGIVSFVCLVNAGETETIIVCFLYSFLLLFQAFEMTQYWFQANLKSKYSSIVVLLAYICVSIYKVYILATQKSVYWFAVSHVIEVAIISFLLLILYRKICKKDVSFSLALGKKMLKKSKYYIWSSLLVILFQQTDKIMLKLMLGEAETGYYSAALTCVGITAFVFGAIIDSARPSILEGYTKSKQLFEKRIRLLFSVISFFALCQSVFMTIFAKQIIYILYGSAYTPSISVLQISIWFVIFGYYGTIRNIWILAEGKQKWLLPINIAGAVINLVGNYLLIPLLGANGAALVSVITQFFTNFVLCYLVKSMRPVGKIIVSSFNPKYLFQYAKSLK